MSLSPGVRLGPYEILSPLGAGGMGEVWRAKDTRVDRAVALKVLPEEFFESEERRQRFEREARMLASLNHPGIATLYSFEESGGRHLLTMELVEGETLARRLASRPLPREESISLACQIAAALEAAHAKGIVHRDLKPGNVMVSTDGRVKLLDFGLAKALGEEVAPADVSHSPTLTAAGTEAGVILGTAAYMSPEQARGQRVDARTDVWAFGVVLYEMLAGGRLFRGESTTDTLAAVLREPVDFKRLPSSTPGDVRDLLARCLERDPRKRLADIGEARSVLEKAEAGGGMTRAVGLRLALVAALLLVATGGGVFLARRKPAPPVAQASVVPSIAVLPFSNLGGDKDQEYFSDGLSEELRGLLTKVKELRVAGRASSFAFKERTDDLAAIGQKLHVATVLEGSVRRAGDRLRVSTQLVSVSDGYQIWAETYDRKLTDVFKVQDEIAGAVVAALKVKLLPQERPSSSRHQTSNTEAFNEYLLGQQFFSRASLEGLRRAADAYRRAITLDPNYAAAHAGLAAVAFQVAADPRGPDARAALAAADRAISLDSELSDGYSARGYLRTLTWDWTGARADLDRALVLDPGNATVRWRQGILLASMGRLPEAIVELKKAVELDPLFGQSWDRLGRVLYAAGGLAEARKALTRALEISPDNEYHHFHLGVVWLLEGNPKAAITEFEHAGAYRRLSGLSMARHGTGNLRESQRDLDELIAKFSNPGAYRIAEVYAWRGESDNAFRWLERAYAQGDTDLYVVKIDPLLDRLRDDPRYTALLRKLNLPAD